MRKQVVLVALLLFSGSLDPARAIVITGGTGTENFTSPGAGLPWANVGSVNGASGVYLGSFGGNFWALTASHLVGSGSSLANLVLDSGTFTFVPGSGIVVRNGDTSATDLTLFRISADPGLANLTLATSAPAASSNVFFIGRGGIEGSLNYWNVTVNPGASDDVWIDKGSNPAGANAIGYLLVGGAGKRWGVNTVTGLSAYNVGTGDTAALYTTFATAQAESGDSGGATFYLNGSSWELAGIMGAIATLENQPGSTAVLGDQTFSASIANYHGFITSAIPEPATTAILCGLGVLTVVGLGRRRRNGR